ncbi:MAG TPA: putative quinol monooxygenase [Candidatus Binatia bacterium]
MHVIAGTFTAKPERKMDVIKLAMSMFDPSRAEAGCISYNFYEDQGNKDAFLFFEEWKDQQAIDQHFATPHFARFMDQFPDMIVGKPTIKIFEIKETKVL